MAGRKSNNENNKRLVSWCLTGATRYKTVSLKKNRVLKEQKTEGWSCSYQVYGSISVYASLEPKREVKDGYLSSQYNQGFQALGTSEIARRARTCPLFIMGNGLQGSSHTPSIKNPCIQAKYRHCNLVQEGLSSQLHRCHGYWALSSQYSALSHLSRKNTASQSIPGTSQGFLTGQGALQIPAWPLLTWTAEAKDRKGDLACLVTVNKSQTTATWVS